MLSLVGLAAMVVKTLLATLAEASGQVRTAPEDYSSSSTNMTSKQAGSSPAIHLRHFQKTALLCAMLVTRLGYTATAMKIQQT